MNNTVKSGNSNFNSDFNIKGKHLGIQYIANIINIEKNLKL